MDRLAATQHAACGDSRDTTSPHASRARTRRSGFSILEVTIGLAILAFGILAATAGQIAAIKLATNSRQSSLAVYLAEEQMEFFQGMPGADLTAMVVTPGQFIQDVNNPIDPIPSDGVAMDFSRRWLIQPGTPEPGIITVTVEVDWQNSLGNIRTAQVQALKADL